VGVRPPADSTRHGAPRKELLVHVLPRLALGQVLAALVVSALVLLTAAAPPALARDHRSHEEIAERMAGVINNARNDWGLPPLHIDVRVVPGAREWTQHMAARHQVAHHPDLWSQVPPEARVAGEVLGRTTSTDAAITLRNRWRESPGHRRVLTDARLTHIGIGVDMSGPYTYATVRLWG
jgi:uncharacterized protein YkwD